MEKSFAKRTKPVNEYYPNLRFRDIIRMLFGAAVAVVVAIVLAPPMLLITLVSPSWRVGQFFGYVWSWSVAAAMGITASLSGAENVKIGDSYIVTPNHQSYIDVLALELVLPVKVLWVIKKELARIPFFGWALSRSGAICINRSNSEEAVKSLREGSSKLVDGWSLLIYPEGTRSPTTSLQPFKKGPFMLAVQTGISILPVTINGAYRIWPKYSIAFRPGHMTVTIGKPISTEGLSEEDVLELIDKTRRAILDHLDEDYSPFRDKMKS
ncbi:MAG: 1-acyl-sn-glycerol-3-phosphate acyltransferase [Thermodesulfobacteriota bacterium]|nr:1-acyl-sn-glycerol-3-phosphate acyltransferase [Thermodesulfobacteriota bacterium]